SGRRAPDAIPRRARPLRCPASTFPISSPARSCASESLPWFRCRSRSRAPCAWPQPMRLLRILSAVVFIALGIALGALNPQTVVLDLGITTLHAGLGVVLLTALLLGAILGGLALALGVITPLRRDPEHVRGRSE